jgi:hypothetical protein
MPRYKIWDKQEDIYTLGKDRDSGKMHWTAAEYIEEKAQYAANPNTKIVVGGGAVNGKYFLLYDEFVEQRKKEGAPVTDGMTDAEILAAIEEFEDNPPWAGEPSPEERMAAAQEVMALNSMPDVE